MNKLITTTIWAVASTTGLVMLVIASIHPDYGLLHSNPMTGVGLGLIGLGLCLDGKKRCESSTPPVDRKIN